MALTFTPIRQPSWEQAGFASGSHQVEMKVTGFAASTFYACIAEVYADAGLPGIGDEVDAALPLVRFQGWSHKQFVCQRSGTPHMYLLFKYSQTSIDYSGGPSDIGPVVVRSRSDIIDVETDFDIDGNQMLLTVDGQDIPVRIATTRRRRLISCSRLENTDAGERHEDLIGKVNEFSYNGYAARTLLLDDIVTDTRDSGDSYDTEYVIIYDRLTHDEPRTASGPDGNPIANPVDGVSRKTFQIIEEASFSPLNLSF